MRPFPRIVATLAALSVVGLGVPALAVLPGAAADRAAAAPAPAATAPELPECPTPQPLASRTEPIGTDANVSVFVGGDYRAGARAAESEGVLAVGGTAVFDKDAPGGVFNVGVVGYGSGTVPPPGSEMLRAGADSTVGDVTTVDVGHGIGGDVVAGGTASPLERYETSGGTVTGDDPDPLGAFADFGATIAAKSAEYASLARTGDVVRNAPFLDFVGDGSSSTQVFGVPGDLLGTATEPTAIRFRDVPADARVIVNVTGSEAGVFPAGFFTDASSAQIDFADPRFVQLATHTMWNFPDATAVTIGTGDQLLGSVMVPGRTASTTITASTNGRVLIGGDLLFAGEGNEAHSYPFPDDDFACKPTIDPPTPTGSLAIRKVVTDPDGVVDAARSYSGTWRCSGPGRAVTPGGSWSVAGDGTETLVAANLPVGASCTVTETTPPAPDPDDPSYSWSAPVVSPSSVRIGAGSPSLVTVTNVVARATATFRIAKALDDPTGSVDPARAFSGTYACAIGDEDVTPADATWTVTAGGDPVELGPVPVGASCTVSEDLDAPPVPGDPSAVWGPPTIAPNPVTIADGQSPLVTVTNHVDIVTGSFTIAKSFIGATGLLPPGTVFRFAWSCTAPGGAPAGSGTLDIVPNTVGTVDDVPAGSRCRVEEGADPQAPDDSYAWRDPVIDVAGSDGPAAVTERAAAFTLPADGETTVRVGYVDQIVQRLGAFAIEKRIDDPASVADADETFDGVYTCTYRGAQLAEGRWEIRADQGPRVVAFGMPFGTVCSANEELPIISPSSDGDRAFVWGSPENDHPNGVVIGEQDDPLGVVRLTNVVEAAITDATIEKVVDDPDGALPAGTPFTGTVRCLPPDGSPAIEQRWSAVGSAGPSSLVTGVPDGSACTVTEDTVAPPDDGHVWQPPVVSPNSFVATAGTTVAVQVLNTLDPTDVVPPTDPPVPPTEPPTPPITPPVTSPGGGNDAGGGQAGGSDSGLAVTGADVLPLAGLAVLLVAGGLVVSVIRASGRRRRG